MIRKQVYITERQETLLKRRAKVAGHTEAELIRDALDKHLSSGVNRRDPESWKRARKFICERMNLKVKPEKRTWTREDAYDELMERYGRRSR